MEWNQRVSKVGVCALRSTFEKLEWVKIEVQSWWLHAEVNFGNKRLEKLVVA